jgi:rod shape-determining protein MreC
MKTPTTETRKGSPLLLVALVVLSLVITSVYVREGDGGPLHGMRSGLLFLTTPFVAVGNVVSTPFSAVGNWFGGLSVNRDDLLTLRKQNAEMRTSLAQLEEQRQENVRLRALLKLPDPVKVGSVGAHVIGRPTDSWEGIIVIDRGSADGVKPGTPVVAAQGLLGQVSVVASHSAKVRLITDQSSGVSVLVQSSRATGVVRGSVEGQLTLEYYAGKQLPKPGDVLITSGLGGAYPKGLVVGDISKVVPDQAGLLPNVDVVSRVPIDRIEEVSVLVGMQPSQLVGGVE